MMDLQRFVSDYIKDKKHLQLVIGIVREGDVEYYSFDNNKKKNLIAPENKLLKSAP
ncbi:hypothetical protein [Paenibacillus pabuli]|uniref:hypothetical protein n=1 Tax=Paenibacillus pabuli TaxID=1472 RepID=UPI003CF6A288